MATLREQAAQMKADMQAIVDRAKAESRDLTDDEATTIEAKAAEHESLVERAERAEKAAKTVAGLASVTVTEPEEPAAPRAKSLGWRIVESEGFKSYRKAHPTGTDGGTPVRFEAKNVGSLADIGLKATLETGTGQPRADVQPGYRDYLPAGTYAPLSLLDLITVGNTASTSLEYRQVVSETNNAAIVPEGELKPLSDLTTDAADAKVHTYADGFDATNQFLADEPALATFMETSVRRHLRQLIEDRILNGPGGASAPTGILHTTGVGAVDFDTDVLTTISNALESLEDVTDPQAIVLNPADAWALRRLKDNDGRYLSGGPFTSGNVPTLWDVPIVKSRRVAAGTALVGNFRSVNFLEREPLSVLAFNQHKDYAQRNMVYVRAELRAMQLIYSPRDIVVATIAAA